MLAKLHFTFEIGPKKLPYRLSKEFSFVADFNDAEIEKVKEGQMFLGCLAKLKHVEGKTSTLWAFARIVRNRRVIY